MIITHADTGTSVLYTAKKGNFMFAQLYSKAIPVEKIEKHFGIEAEVLYERWLESDD